MPGAEWSCPILSPPPPPPLSSLTTSTGGETVLCVPLCPQTDTRLVREKETMAILSNKLPDRKTKSTGAVRDYDRVDVRDNVLEEGTPK